jgi:hypothetical protein
MVDMISPQRGAYERLGPTDAGAQAINPAAVTTAAGNIDLNGTWGGAPVEGVTRNRIARGGAWFSFQPSGGAASIRFKASATTAATTAANGLGIADGSVEEFWVSSGTPIVDAIGSAALTLKIWMSSRNYQP